MVVVVLFEELTLATARRRFSGAQRLKAPCVCSDVSRWSAVAPTPLSNKEVARSFHAF